MLRRHPFYAAVLARQTILCCKGNGALSAGVESLYQCKCELLELKVNVSPTI